MTLLEDLLKRGVYLQFDVFGNPWQLKMNDKAAADAIVTLAKKGFSRQLLVSHDMCTKFHLTRFGGAGLQHIHRVILPYLRSNGLSDLQIQEIMISNPSRVLPLAMATSHPLNQ